MESLTCYNFANKEYSLGLDKEAAKLYGEARECYEKSIEYFIGALNRKKIFFVNKSKSNL